MAGKNRGSTFPNRDSFQRINFLYQASALMHGKSAALSCHYGNVLKQIGKKSVLRIHPNIKRTLCKRCGIILRPTTSMDLEIDDEKKKVCTIKCLNCNFSRNYHINANYKLWIENEASIVDRYPLNENSNLVSGQAPTNSTNADSNNSSSSNRGQVKSKRIKMEVVKCKNEINNGSCSSSSNSKKDSDRKN